MMHRARRFGPPLSFLAEEERDELTPDSRGISPLQAKIDRQIWHDRRRKASHLARSAEAVLIKEHLREPLTMSGCWGVLEQLNDFARGDHRLAYQVFITLDAFTYFLEGREWGYDAACVALIALEFGDFHDQFFEAV